MGKLLRRLRPLIVIYAVAGVAAGYEVIKLRDARKPAAPGEMRRPLQDLLRDDREVAVLERLYPQRKDTNFLQGVRALMPREGMPDLQAARRHFERALTADENDEDLLRVYALTLMLQGADPVLTDAVVEDWRRRYPLSKNPDPRALPKTDESRKRGDR